MNPLADVKWIKLATGLPDNRKIKQIRKLPDGDTIALMWVFLMCLAGETNSDGMVFFTPEIPYTDEMLAEQFKMDVNTIRLGLSTFQRFGMIEIIDDIICLSTWEKWQSVDELAAIREQTRKRVARHREKQKLAASNVTCNVTVTQCNGIERDKEEEGEREKDSITVSKVTVCRTDVQRIIENWNTLGLSQLKTIKAGTQRYEMLKKRIKDYGLDAVLEAINRIRQSSFLTGNNKNGWVITFDWFVKPNNFPKVYEGNYDDGQAQARKERMSNGSNHEPASGEYTDGRYGIFL